MPELPEVENYRLHVEQTSLGQQIDSVEIYDQKVLKCTDELLLQTTEGQRITSTQRIGKYLFLHLSSKSIVALHFGMSGSLKYESKGNTLPRFTRVAFELSDGVLAYICPRKFGRIDIADSIEAFSKSRKLSKDALELSFTEFKRNLQGRKTAIKSALLNQSITAEVGNWIVDELLFHARIHPKRRVNTLGEKHLSHIYEAMQEVLKIAITYQANYQNFPANYLIHRRGWTDHDDTSCGKCGNDTLYFKVGGRATYMCPQCQKM